MTVLISHVTKSISHLNFYYIYKKDTHLKSFPSLKGLVIYGSSLLLFVQHHPHTENRRFHHCPWRRERMACAPVKPLCDSVSVRRGPCERVSGVCVCVGGGLCCWRHIASVGCLRSVRLIIPRHSGQ